MLVDNDKMFASNYPKPHITFAHMDGEQMTVHQAAWLPEKTQTGREQPGALLSQNGDKSAPPTEFLPNAQPLSNQPFHGLGGRD